MDYLLHRQKCPGHILTTPEGLQELLSDISREVLRCQPTENCIYKFIADYLEDMVATRDKCSIAMEIINDAILKTDEVYSQFVKCNIPKDKTNSFLDLMEITFRRFIDQKRRRNQDPRYIRFHADDMLEELVRKCDLTKIEILRSRPVIQWAYKKFVKTYLDAVEGCLDTEDLYFNTEKCIASNRELEELDSKIILIQKTYRGYRTRKQLREDQSREKTKAEAGNVRRSLYVRLESENVPERMTVGGLNEDADSYQNIRDESTHDQKDTPEISPAESNQSQEVEAIPHKDSLKTLDTADSQYHEDLLKALDVETYLEDSLKTLDVVGPQDQEDSLTIIDVVVSQDQEESPKTLDAGGTQHQEATQEILDILVGSQHQEETPDVVVPQEEIIQQSPETEAPP